MFFFSKNFIFIVFEVIHQLQALVFVNKVLNAFNHTPPKIVV